MFKGVNNPVCLNHFALQQPKVDLTRGDTAGGVEPQETTIAFRDVASTGHDTNTGLDHISDDHADSMVCMCVSCVGVQCNIPQRSHIHLSENASQNSAILVQKYILHI